MAYRLGIDIGTTYTAAAIVENGQVSIVALGDRAPVVPTVVFLRDDDEILTGDAANRRGATEPGRVARQFKRRVGDPTPMLLGGSPMSPQALVAKMLRWTVDRVSQLQGGPPDHITVSHPANWGAYKLDLLQQAMRMAELGATTTLTEPEAAATYYASTQRVETGDVVAVYDLGGGTFDAAVLRKTADGFEILGTPEGIEHLGGIDIDEAVYAHVANALGGALDSLDPDDPLVQASVARLRADCVDAKEALSTDSSTSIPVLLSNVQAEVRMTRDELERMIRPWLSDTIAALRRALRSAGVEPAGISTVLLVGGSSRIPLVAQMVSEDLGRPVAVDAHPKHTVALGAALAAGEPAVAVVVPPPVAPPPPSPSEPVAAPPLPPPVIPADIPVVPAPKKSRRGVLIAAIVLAIVLIGGAIALTQGGGKKNNASSNTGSSSSSSSTSSSSAASTTGTTLLAVPVGASGRGVRIDGIAIKDGKYSVDYRTAGFNPKISDDTSTHHIHFFWNDEEQANAGTNGPNPGFWVLYDVPSPFTGLKVADRPADANEICSLVADSLHQIELGTGNCFPLPDA